MSAKRKMSEEKRARKRKIYRDALAQISLEQNDYEIRVLQLDSVTATYVASNGQETESEGSDYEESEGSYYEDITDTEIRELSEEEVSDMEIDNSLKEWEIAMWVHEYQVSQASLKYLLHLLREKKIVNFPLDARTILNYPRTVNVISKCGGNYMHLGLEKGIVRLIEIFPTKFKNYLITFDLNIDGLPLFKSSNGCLWPTLCRVMNFQPFVVSLFYGYSKPKDVKELLKDLLVELKELETKEIVVNDKTFKLKLRCFICDAPARQFLKCVKSHKGYYSCERCKIKGKTIHGGGKTVIFPYRNTLPNLRKDDEFNNYRYKKTHQKDLSPIARYEINISCINDFVLDPMHLVFLGVVKKIFQFYKNKKPAKLSAHNLVLLEERLKEIKRLPEEFARHPRTLDNVDRFKATEFRTLILYTGPVILRGILSNDQYKHFLSLTIAMSVLLDEDDEFRNRNLNVAKQNLVYFVQNASRIFGQNFMTYNTHNLLHLLDDVERFDCSLNDISAFPFENHLRKLKCCVSQGVNPIVQLVKKIKGLETANLDQKPFKKKKENRAQRRW